MSDDLFALTAPQDEHGTTEAGPAHMQPVTPVSPLTQHFLAAMREYMAAHEGGQVAELLALGSVRSVYWLALGSGETALATNIATWWADMAPLHGLGEIIK